jgi:bifunctional non-homologous end joining protein LigD
MTPPVGDTKGLSMKGVHWARPELVAQVGFSEWTPDGKLRHPRYVGLRDDKRPEQVVRERAQET